MVPQALQQHKQNRCDVEIILLLLILLSLLPFLAYALAYVEIFFVFGKEGRAIPIERGGESDHFILTYRGHRPNDPRLGVASFGGVKRPWEIQKLGLLESNTKVSVYKKGSPWRLLEYLGIYYYGFFPFKKIGYKYREWVEERQDPVTGLMVPWVRRERTKYIHVASFTYLFELKGAENKEGFPTTLKYAVVVEITNLYLSDYGVADWMKRLTAECNAAGREWVAARTYQEAIAERSASIANDNDFAKTLLGLNELIKTQQPATPETVVGLPEAIGVRILAASLQTVELEGVNAKEIATATVAKGVAELNAQAAIATATGQAKTVEIAADAEKYRIHTTYSAVQQFGEAGMLMRQIDALQEASKGPGTNMIWANNPLSGILGNLFNKPPAPPKPPEPPATT